MTVEAVHDARPTDDDRVVEFPEPVQAVADEVDEAPPTTDVGESRARRWQSAVVYGVIPALAFLAAVTAGALKWMDGQTRGAETAAVESVQAARDSTIALLSYQPDNAQTNLEAAQGRLTGAFRDSYSQLIHDVVIPGSKEKQISAIANVPAAASISASATHATVLVFVNQTSIVGKDAPTNTASAVRVTLDKVGGQWLVAGFNPI